jgi:hypothetical protein
MRKELNRKDEVHGEAAAQRAMLSAVKTFMKAGFARLQP